MKILAAICLCATLLGCGLKPSLDADKLSDRDFQLEQFFDGHTKAYGQFQDVLGNVSRRFTVDIAGTWSGNTLTLVEDFTYADKTTEQRVWTLTKADDGSWHGTAPGVIVGLRRVRSAVTCFIGPTPWIYRCPMGTCGCRLMIICGCLAMIVF